MFLFLSHLDENCRMRDSDYNTVLCICIKYIFQNVEVLYASQLICRYLCWGVSVCHQCPQLE